VDIIGVHHLQQVGKVCFYHTKDYVPCVLVERGTQGMWSEERDFSNGTPTCIALLVHMAEADPSGPKVLNSF
jgi:hypothetical protein